MGFKENLAYILQARGYTYAEAAEATGLSSATIGRLVRGKHEPTKITVKTLSRGLECSIADLIGEELPTRIKKPAAMRNQTELRKEVENAVKGTAQNVVASGVALAGVHAHSVVDDLNLEIELRNRLSECLIATVCACASKENADLFQEFGKHIIKKYLGGNVDEDQQV